MTRGHVEACLTVAQECWNHGGVSPLRKKSRSIALSSSSTQCTCTHGTAGLVRTSFVLSLHMLAAVMLTTVGVCLPLDEENAFVMLLTCTTMVTCSPSFASFTKVRFLLPTRPSTIPIRHRRIRKCALCGRGKPTHQSFNFSGR